MRCLNCSGSLTCAAFTGHCKLCLRVHLENTVSYTFPAASKLTHCLFYCSSCWWQLSSSPLSLTTRWRPQSSSAAVILSLPAVAADLNPSLSSDRIHIKQFTGLNVNSLILLLIMQTTSSLFLVIEPVMVLRIDWQPVWAWLNRCALTDEGLRYGVVVFCRLACLRRVCYHGTSAFHSDIWILFCCQVPAQTYRKCIPDEIFKALECDFTESVKVCDTSQIQYVL